MQSTLTSRSGGHQSVKEHHLGLASNSNDSLPPPLQTRSDDGDNVTLHRPKISRSSCDNNIIDINSSNSNNNSKHKNNNNMYKLLASFAATFVAVHHLLQLLFFVTTSQSSSKVQRAKRCVEMEPNIFHCTNDNTTPSGSTKKSDGNNSNNRQQSYVQGSAGEIILHNKSDKDGTYPYRGVAQNVSGNDEERRKMIEVLQSMEQYWNRWILATASIRQKYDEIYFANICANKNERCVFWASVGECTNNPEYMINECTLACQVCEKFVGVSLSSVVVGGGPSNEL